MSLCLYLASHLFSSVPLDAVKLLFCHCYFNCVRAHNNSCVLICTPIRYPSLSLSPSISSSTRCRRFFLSRSATDYHITESIPNQMQYIAFDPSHIQIFHGNGLTAQIVSTFVIVPLRVGLFMLLFYFMFFAHFRSTKIGLPHQRGFIHFCRHIWSQLFSGSLFWDQFERWNVLTKRLFVYRVILQLVAYCWSGPHWISWWRNFRK